MKNLPLVSIGIITYNSSDYVIETLESVKNQTYKNIELIISDDCSTDDTVEKCNRWLNLNNSQFVRSKLITSKINTGIVRNFNRALAECKGEWIKTLAGDDVFFSDAIEKYINFVLSDTSIKCCMGRAVNFVGTVPSGDVVKQNFWIENLFFKGKSTAKRQFNILIHTFAGSGNSVFYKKELIDELGPFDERFPLQEDHPYFIKVTKAGYKFYLLDENTVYYRQNPASVCHKDAEGKYFSPQEVRYIQQYKYEYCNEQLWWIGKMLLHYSLWIRNKIINSGNSPLSKLSLFYFQIYRITDPIMWECRFLEFLSKMN